MSSSENEGFGDDELQSAHEFDESDIELSGIDSGTESETGSVTSASESDSRSECKDCKFAIFGDRDGADVGSDDMADDDEVRDGDYGHAARARQPRQWSANTHNINVDAFEEKSGPAHQLDENATELDFFNLFFTDEILDSIASETNVYAQQRIEASGNPDPLWNPTIGSEMRAYIAINIMMGIKQEPRICCYWSSNPALNCAWISNVMPQTRFLKITQYLHLRDNTNMPRQKDDNFDPLFKIRPLLDAVARKFREVYRPECELSIHEGTVAFKGFQQHDTKRKIKVWQCCESSSGYCLNLQVHTGQVSGPQVPHDLGYHVVMDMLQPYLQKKHHVFFDRFLTSVQLMEDLEAANTYACATVMLNRQDLPAAARRLKLKQRGETVFQQKGNMVLSVWKDKRQVSILSTNCNPVMNEQAHKPEAVLKCNVHMGGLHRSDQLRSYYHTGRASKKWWRHLLWYLIDTCIINACVLYKKGPRRLPRGYDQLKFRVNLAEYLRAGFTSCKYRKGRRSSTLLPAVHPGNTDAHTLVPVGNKRQKAVCVQCSLQKRKTPKGYQVQSSVKCRMCDVCLCRVHCFRDYHS